MTPPPHWGRRRPPWWPDEEPWPPTGPHAREVWRRLGGGMARRLAGLVMMIIVLTVGACTLAFWLMASVLGMVDLPQGTALAGGLAALAIGAGGLILAAWAFRRVTAPIREFMEAVGRVAGGDFTARVAVRRPREVAALARAFNAMAERLQASEAQRRGLLADVTHELRTPLTVVQGQLEGVLDGVYPADAEHLGPILDETRVLSRLIDDLRTLTLAESGTLTLSREPTDLAVLATEAANAFRAQAEAAGVELRVEAGDDLPLLNVDPVRLREVLNNLLANALRYTPREGQVTLRAAMMAGGPETGDGQSAVGGPLSTVVFTVSDTGAGIPAETLPHIFERFYKSADSRGSGLGLAIARNLVLAHGGTLTAESNPGAGTTMTVELPGNEG